MTERLPEASLDKLFRTARTRNGWMPEQLPEALLREVYELAKWGPTSANVSPARFVFVVSDDAKARLAPHVSDSNRPKIMAAPCCVIVGQDLGFAEHIPALFPHNPGAATWFGDPEMARITAFRNSSLQGAYLMLAARSLGLDCGPMSGFNNAGVDAEFFAGTKIVSNFLCNIGHGTDEAMFARLPRLPFETACKIL
jgi:3-hydroxypropanoate dehydrogenase